jgi:hypothetical protein
VSKPRINYIDLAGPLAVGQPARLLLVDRRWYRTSPVIETTFTTIGPIIETHNTMYWPSPTDESLPVPSIPRRIPREVVSAANVARWQNPFK